MALRPNMRRGLKERLGWSPRATHEQSMEFRAQGGQTLFEYKGLLNNQNEITDIYVAVDGVMMMDNHDYRVDKDSGTVIFDSRIHRLDGGEKVEIRTTGPDVDPLQRVLLLARKNGLYEFTDEELNEFAESAAGSVFAVDQIAKYGDNAAKLTMFAGKRIQVLAFEVTEEGLIGTEQRILS